MAKWTAQDRTNSGIKFKICSTMLLYSKERQIPMISIGLLEVESAYDKRQDAITTDWRSNQQT